jgi:hypothetical protein
MKLLLGLIGKVLRVSIFACIYLTPVLGVWLASSLAAFSNRSTILSVVAGIFLFPVLPLLWELWAERKRGKLGKSKDQVLTWGDRLTLRTLAINAIAITLLLVWQPRTIFIALSTRGDWMLDGMKGDTVQLVRQSLFKVAGGLEGLYKAFNKNPFEQFDDDSSKRSPSQDLNQTSKVAAKPEPASNKSSWAWDGQGLHPAVVNIPANVETSIESVGQYIASKESDPMLRVKALHDYVADRIAYDAESYFAGKYPPQDAETVFRTRKAVCAGYAKLLEALGKAAGQEIVYVVGNSRSQTSDLSGQGHAWNAAKVKGQWYLIDPTWDSGYVDRATGFTKKYHTEYLMPPPEVIGITHFPKDPVWQLRANPIPLGEFLRQPMMRPKFFADGLALITPQRSQTDTNAEARINFSNPQKRWVLASYNPKGGSSENCGQPVQGEQVTCKLPSAGAYEVKLFTSAEGRGKFSYVGQLEFNKT